MEKLNHMKMMIIFLSVCVATLVGCTNSYRGIYWIRSEAGDSPAIRRQQAVAVREAVLKVTSEVGFEIREKGDTSTYSVLPGFMAVIPLSGLHEPYKTLSGEQPHLWLSVSFTHPFSIVISDLGNASDSELVRRLKARLETELANVKPAILVSYRVDRTRLD